MLIIFETKSHLRLTLCSSSHDTSKQIARAGIKPFAGYESESTVATSQSQSQTSTQSRSKSSPEDKRSTTPSTVSKPFRCHSLRLRLSRHFPFISPMSRNEKSNFYYDQPAELPGSPRLQELPDPLLVPSFHELKGDTESQFGYQHYIPAMRNRPEAVELPVTWGEPNSGYGMQQEYKLTNTPSYDLSLYTTQLNTPPGLVSRRQSHTLSPISLFTPIDDIGTGYGEPDRAELHYQTTPDGYNQYAREGYNDTQDLPTPLMSPGWRSPAEVSHTPTPTSDRRSVNLHQQNGSQSAFSSSSQGFAFNQLDSQESPMPHHGVPTGGPLSHCSEVHSPDPWENRTPSNWESPPLYGQDLVNNNHAKHLAEGVDPVSGFGHSEALPTYNAALADRPIVYSPMTCTQCGKTFNGRYRRGNLTRHIKDFHSLIRSTVGKACRICRKVYNRTDAKRKHEWEKHHILDAKPNKKRRSIAAVELV